MLRILHGIECELPEMLQDASGWNSLFVNYHPPFVERLWCQCLDFRVFLHRIHPCGFGEALFHPHPWPSAMRMLSGKYEMAVGYGAGDREPPIAARIIMGAGAEYEMIEPDAWHYVRPIGGPTMSLMVTGKPWNRTSPKSEKPLNPLRIELKDEILSFFRKQYA